MDLLRNKILNKNTNIKMKRYVRPSTRRSTRRRRYFRRPVTRKGWKSSQFLSVVRSTTGNFITGVTGASTGVGSNFILSQMPNYTEFTNLFDKYKIKRIWYRFRIYKNPDGVAPNLYPVIHHAIDNNDASNPTLTGILEYPGVKTTVLNDSKPVSRWFSFKPKASINVASASFAQSDPWVDTGSAAALYYGMKAFVEQQVTGINIAIDIKYRMWFKDIK